jgi:hypothetical protein
LFLPLPPILGSDAARVLYPQIRQRLEAHLRGIAKVRSGWLPWSRRPGQRRATVQLLALAISSQRSRRSSKQLPQITQKLYRRRRLDILLPDGRFTSPLDGTAIRPIRHEGSRTRIQTFTRYRTVYPEGAFTAIRGDHTNAVIIGICAPRNLAFLPDPEVL